MSGHDLIREYVERMGPKYRRGDRGAKGRVLDEFCALCGIGRKYAVRLLKGRRRLKGAAGARGRKAVYGPSDARVLAVIWRKARQPCGKRLAQAIATWLPYYEIHHGALEEGQRERIEAMSAATMDRLLRPQRVRAGRRGLCGTKPGTLLRTQIPIRTRWEDAQDCPGWIEADTVAHCGGSMAGDFVWSLTLTDIYSGWSELRAVWNRGAHGVVQAVADIEAALAFPLLGFDCDNGSEFLNHHLVSHFARREAGVKFTRGRPYMSNDNAHVEQKNWTHVRELLGYERMDAPELVGLVNQLYRPWGLLHNFFLPSMKLKEKHRDGAKVHRTHELARTPYDRLMECPKLAQEAKDRLRATRDKLDPFDLDRQIALRLKPIIRWLHERSRAPGALPPDPRSLSHERPSERGPEIKGPDLSDKPGPPVLSARPPAAALGSLSSVDLSS